MAIDKAFGQQVIDNPLILLDLTNDIEQMLPGGSETERNESRLNHIITGKSRPSSHVANEVGAWGISNIGIPLASAGASKYLTIAKGRTGLKLLNKVPNEVYRKGGIAAGEAVYKKAAKEAAEKAAESAPKAAKGVLGTIAKMMHSGSRAEVKAKAAKADLDAVMFAIKAVSSRVPGLNPVDVIKNYGTKKAAKTLIGTIAAIKAGKLGNILGQPKGKDEYVENYDPRLEMGIPGKALQIVKGLADLDDLDTNKYDMKKVDSMLKQLNDGNRYWNQKQIDDLSGSEKIKLVKDISKGKYRDKGDIGFELYRIYDNLTNTKEE